jgi:hypothetical protein
MELTIKDLENLMFNGGINAMREGLEYKQIICEEITKLQERVKKEFEALKHEIDEMTTDDIILNNYKIYTYYNLYLFFIEHEPEMIYDNLIVKLLEECITKNQIGQFFLINNILYQLYDGDLSYDTGSQTGSYDDIINLIIDFCSDLK